MNLPSRLSLLHHIDHAVNHVEAGPEQDPEGAEGAVADQEQNQGKPRCITLLSLSPFL